VGCALGFGLGMGDWDLETGMGGIFADITEGVGDTYVEMEGAIAMHLLTAVGNV